MSEAPGLVPGVRAGKSIVVAEEHTAPHVGSGQVRVLATPVLTNLFEAAALAAAEPYVPAGRQTVGTLLSIRHLAATPVGMRVDAHAEVIAVEGRLIRFRVWADDEVEAIGEGTHERIMIGLDAFDARMGAKILRRVPSVRRAG